MNVEVIHDISRFRDMRIEWNTLLEKSNAISIYLTWEWLYTWWEIFHNQRGLYILAVRDNGVLVGIAPLLLQRYKHYSLLSFTRLEFLGTGEDEIDEVCSNYMDFIVKDNSKKVYDIILRYIWRGFKEKKWDEVLLNNTPADSEMITVVNEETKKNLNNSLFSVDISNSTTCAVVNLPEQWDEYLNYIDKSWRNQIRRGRKEISTKGTAECVLIADPDKLSSAFGEFMRIHQKRWQDVGKPGAFASKKFTSFHENILKLFADKKWVGIRLLKCNGKTVAASYTFHFNKVIYFYSSAYDRDFKTKIGVGLLERSYDIEQAIMGGYKQYDFYKAREGSYKWHLAKDKRVVCDIHIFGKTFKYYLLTGAKYIVQSLKAAFLKVNTMHEKYLTRAN